MTQEYIGRAYELGKLNALTKKNSASLVAIRGRRRIGKSRFVKEFARDKKFFSFSGIPPVEGVTAQEQRDVFALQFGQQTGMHGIKIDDWMHLFTLLANQVSSGRVIILFDEISWMGSEDPTFLGKLKNAWDNEFSNNPKLMLILCGSVSTWIEENIINSTAFFGRISSYITLNELSLAESNVFLNARGFRGSTYEKFKLLSVTGGVPWYIGNCPGGATNSTIK